MNSVFLKEIQTDKNQDEFQLRLLKQDGVGLLTTRTSLNYLILDSIDYWFDLIQQSYPQKKKCTCQNDWFRVCFKYIPRQDSDDVRQVSVITVCTNCRKEKEQMAIDIDYSPTNELIDKPITFCEKPKIKYQLKDLNCFWTEVDLMRFLTFMMDELNFEAYCWFWNNKKRFLEKTTLPRALEIINKKDNYHYLNFYFSQNFPGFKTFDDQSKGIYLQGDPWRNHEIIQLSSPTIMNYGDYEGFLYYVKFCNQYIDKGIVKNKSQEFFNLTENIILWMEKNYVQYRGKYCYDNEKERTRLFGDKYSSKHIKLN